MISISNGVGADGNETTLQSWIPSRIVVDPSTSQIPIMALGTIDIRQVLHLVTPECNVGPDRVLSLTSSEARSSGTVTRIQDPTNCSSEILGLAEAEQGYDCL